MHVDPVPSCAKSKAEARLLGSLIHVQTMLTTLPYPMERTGPGYDAYFVFQSLSSCALQVRLYLGDASSRSLIMFIDRGDYSGWILCHAVYQRYRILYRSGDMHKCRSSDGNKEQHKKTRELHTVSSRTARLFITAHQIPAQ